MMDWLDRLNKRAQEIRKRALLRSWEYRQLRYAKGAWYRLRRVLAAAQDAYAISAQDAKQLLAEGFSPLPVGRELEPQKTIFFVPPERITRLRRKKALAVRLSAEFLGTRFVALVRFPLETTDSKMSCGEVAQSARKP